MLAKSSDMLNKITVGVKKCKAGEKHRYESICASLSTNLGQEGFYLKIYAIFD